jgi:hypothetical protein
VENGGPLDPGQNLLKDLSVFGKYRDKYGGVKRVVLDFSTVYGLGSDRSAQLGRAV